MRRVMLLTLLSLAVPTAALANPINLFTGTFVGGSASRTVSGGFAAGILNVAVNGTTARMHLNTLGTLSGGCNPSGSCTFSGGSITVTNAAGNMTLFTGTLTNGMVTTTGAGGTAVIMASLVGQPVGSFVRLNLVLGANTSLLAGSVGNLKVVPEPSTLGLLGTGLIGLAETVRRKRRLMT